MSRAAQEALVEQRLQGVRVGLGDLLGSLVGATSREDREPTEEAFLVAREQVIRPLDRRAQCLLPGIGVAGALEQIETLGELVQQLLGAEERRTRSGELERERKLVEAQAELTDRLARGEGRIDRAGPHREERLAV